MPDVTLSPNGISWAEELKNKAAVRDVADWCRRELERAHAIGTLETRPFVQNAALIIAALDHIANPLLAPEHPDANGALECWSIIQQLRAPEGAEVCLFCDNPDVGMGANNALEVCDDWTAWRHMRFEGDTLLEALRAALKASKGDGRG